MPIFFNQPEPAAERQPRAAHWPYLLALALMGAVLLIYRLATPGLMDPDEGRYAEIAREMLAYKDWLIPHLNALPYLEKPPLVYWLTALSFKTLGYTELAARLPVALSALGGIFLAYYLARVLWGPAAAFLAATVLASCAGYVVMGRLLTLDMTFALLLNAAVGMGYLALSRGRTRLWPWAYLALGLAVLAKGPVAVVLAGLIWGLWVLLPGEGETKNTPLQPASLQVEVAKSRVLTWLRAIPRRPWRALVQPWGWLLLAAVALPWFILVQRRYPQFFHFFIIEQHLGRYLTPAIHPEPVYFYLPVLLGLMLPWSWLLPWALWSDRTTRDRDRLFLLIWAGAVLGFFSLSQGKLPPYILPALLPLALLLGQRLEALGALARQSCSARGLNVSLTLWALTGVGLTALYFWQPPQLSQALSKANLASPLLLAAVTIFALTPLAALIRRRLGLLFLGALLLSALVPATMERLSLRRSPRNLALVLKSHWQPGAALVGVGLYSQGMSFYSGQIFHLLYCHTELDPGLRLEPDSRLCLANGKELAALAQSRPRLFLFVKEKDLPGVAPDLPGPLVPLGHHKDCLLLSYKGKY
jgi:4-amino-4-deoxy-L-arabinose transferase-like glycosyltransferase